MKAVFWDLFDRDPSDMSYDFTDTAMIANSVAKSELKCISMSALRASKGFSKDRPYKLELVKSNFNRLPETISIVFEYRWLLFDNPIIDMGFAEIQVFA